MSRETSIVMADQPTVRWRSALTIAGLAFLVVSLLAAGVFSTSSLSLPETTYLLFGATFVFAVLSLALGVQRFVQRIESQDTDG